MAASGGCWRVGGWARAAAPDAGRVSHPPELGHWESRVLTSLVGLAPWSGDRGNKRGHRAIRGGRIPVGLARYRYAWAAIRRDGEVHRLYDRLRQRGKRRNVSVAAVMLQAPVAAHRGRSWERQAG